jgi:anti-anti-sigma factor
MTVSAAFSSKLIAARHRDDAPLLSREGDRTVVWLDGDHDVATVLVLADTLARAVAIDEGGVVVDLDGVTFIGSATIEMLIRCRDILSRQSRSLTLRSPSRCALRMLEVCQLTSMLEPEVNRERQRMSRESA